MRKRHKITGAESPPSEERSKKLTKVRMHLRTRHAMIETVGLKISDAGKRRARHDLDFLGLKSLAPVKFDNLVLVLLTSALGQKASNLPCDSALLARTATSLVAKTFAISGEELEQRSQLRGKGVAIQAGRVHGEVCRSQNHPVPQNSKKVKKRTIYPNRVFSCGFLFVHDCKICWLAIFGFCLQVAEGGKNKAAQYRWLYDRKR